MMSSLFVLVFVCVAVPTSYSSSISRLLEILVDTDYSDEPVQTAPVVVDLYYESLCPGCRYFVETQLYPTYYKLQRTGVAKFNMFPYGNAKETKNPDGSWRFECQHGARECTGNIIEACIVSHSNWDSSLYLPVLSCMEGSDDPIASAKGCVTALSTLDYRIIRKCSQGSEGNALMHEMGVATEKLSPPHNYVPWVVVNGRHNETIENAALTDLLSLICQNVEGEKPRQCMA